MHKDDLISFPMEFFNHILLYLTFFSLNSSLISLIFLYKTRQKLKVNRI